MANVSVIIPCYNAEKTIKETIESVLAQTYQDFEIIVVDDGSTDHSREIIQSFGSKVNYIYQENSGQSAARNTAIRAANGKYLAFLDADDLWIPDKLEKQLDLMQHEDIHWCYCDCEYFLDQDGKSIGTYSSLIRLAGIGWIAGDLLMGNMIASPTPIVSKEIIDKAGFFDQTITFGEDWEEWIRISVISPVVYVPEVLAKHRIHENSITYMQNPDVIFFDHEMVINKLCDKFPDHFSPLKNLALAHYSAVLSKSHFLQGEFSKAKTLVKKAISWNPKISYKALFAIYSLPAPILKGILLIRNHIRRIKE